MCSQYYSESTAISAENPSDTAFYQVNENKNITDTLLRVELHDKPI